MTTRSTPLVIRADPSPAGAKTWAVSVVLITAAPPCDAQDGTGQAIAISTDRGLGQDMGLTVNGRVIHVAGSKDVSFEVGAQRPSDINVASFAGMMQNVTSHLYTYFLAKGFTRDITQDLVQPVMEAFSAQVRDVLQDPYPHVQGLKEIRVGQLKLDFERRVFWRGEHKVHLSPKEFALLAVLMKNAGRPLTHVKLVRSVWGVEYGNEAHYLRTYVCALRKKIERVPSNPEYILSEPWVGYRFSAPDDH